MLKSLKVLANKHSNVGVFARTLRHYMFALVCT